MNRDAVLAMPEESLWKIDARHGDAKGAYAHMHGSLVRSSKEAKDIIAAYMENAPEGASNYYIQLPGWGTVLRVTKNPVDGSYYVERITDYHTVESVEGLAALIAEWSTIPDDGGENRRFHEVRTPGQFR